MESKTLIAECTAYDFKVMLEEKKPKSWLKSVSAFANGLGGSLFFGIDNDGIVKGLDDVQHVCEAISSKIRDYMDPLPEVEMIPHDIDGLHILQLEVNAGHYTPYYYVGDGQRIAIVRVGDESLPATAEQMVRLVLKGSNKTYDSLHTDYKIEDYAFTILANTFKDRTKQEWDKKYLFSFGLVTGIGNLTNAGALFADDCPLWQSRLYCTRWDGIEKGDAINDAEFTGNVLMLLREAMNFVKSNTKRGWEKLPDGRKNKPEYAERAVLETMVNHFIHRDYTVMGSEVHLDIYDDRLTVTSPGGMYNGMLIQDWTSKMCLQKDSLDNRAIYNELVTYIKKKKRERQIILVTHNSNVVVSADAENVIVANQEGSDSHNRDGMRFQYVNGALEFTKSRNPEEPSVLYSQGIREHVCDILEGGRDAFEKREQKYGFK